MDENKVFPRPASVRTPEALVLEAALRRKVATKNCESYLRKAFMAWEESEG